MRFTRYLKVGWASMLVLGCAIAFGQPNEPGGGMPPPHMNGMKPGMGPGGPNGGMGQMKHHRGEEFRRVWERLQKEKPEEIARLEKLKRTNREEYFRELRKDCRILSLIRGNGMTKDEIKACILLKQQEMPFDVKEREERLPLDGRDIITIPGVRRCGKSTRTFYGLDLMTNGSRR